MSEIIKEKVKEALKFDCERRGIPYSNFLLRTALSKDKAYKGRKRVERIIGSKCVLCSSKRIIYHEIHGKPHKSSYYGYFLEHSKDFVPMCRACHIFFNILASTKKRKINFSQLEKLLKKYGED